MKISFRRKLKEHGCALLLASQVRRHIGKPTRYTPQPISPALAGSQASTRTQTKRAIGCSDC